MTQQVSNRPNIRNISNFKEKLAGGGARPNIFEVSIPDFPDFAKNQWDNNTRLTFNFLCKAAALPASNVAPIDVPFRGRILKVAGDRTFDTWTVTIINDEDFKIRHAFEVWMNGINKLDNATGATSPSSLRNLLQALHRFQQVGLFLQLDEHPRELMLEQELRKLGLVRRRRLQEFRCIRYHVAA